MQINLYLNKYNHNIMIMKIQYKYKYKILKKIIIKNHYNNYIVINH